MLTLQENHMMRLEDEVFETCLELVSASRQHAEGDDVEIAGAARDRLLRAISRAIMDAPDDRTDSSGRARAGSQLQIQLFVNLDSAGLSNAILAEAESLRSSGVRLDWVSPVASEFYREYRDREFLAISCRRTASRVRLIGLLSALPESSERNKSRGYLPRSYSVPTNASFAVVNRSAPSLQLAKCGQANCSAPMPSES